MTDTSAPTSNGLAADVKRLADAVECLVRVLVERIPPPRPAQRVDEEVPTPAHELYLSGQWKRRSGNIIPAPTPSDLSSSPNRLDPWVRIDVPAVEPFDGDTGLESRPVDS